MARPRLISDEQILERMREALSARGPQVSLDIVAEELGVTAPALLKRFGTRHALVVQALRFPTNPPWFAALEAGPDHRPITQQLDALLEQLGGFFAEVMPLMLSIRAAGITPQEVYKCAGGTPLPLRAVGAISSWLSRAHQRGLVNNAVPFDAVATAVMGSVQARFIHAHISGESLSVAAQRRYLHDVATLFSRTLLPERSLTHARKPTRAKRNTTRRTT